MTLRNLPALSAAATAAVLASTAGPLIAAAPAHAATGQIRLTLSHQGPIFVDNDGLAYDIVVSNTGPDEATGVSVRTTGWECQGADWSLSSCRALPDRYDPAKLMDFTTDIASIPPGGHVSFPVVSLLPDENTGTVRTTVEVVRSDQYDTASVPATCSQGWNPQADCMSDVVPLG